MSINYTVRIFNTLKKVSTLFYIKMSTDFVNQPFELRRRRTNTIITHISSKNKNLAQCPNTNFTVSLESSLLDSIIGIVVNRVFLPNVIDNIHGTCVDIQIELIDTTLINITVPEGFYSITDLGDFITTAFNAAPAPEVLSFTFNSNTSEITFSTTGPRTFRFNVAPTSGIKDIARDKLKVPVGDAFATTKTSTGKVDLYPRTQSLFIELNFTKSNYILPQFSERSILIDIPVLGPFGSITSYKNSGDLETQIDFNSPDSFDALQIRVLDDDLNEPPELSDFDWHMTLVLLK